MAPTIVRNSQFRPFCFSRGETRIHVHFPHLEREAKSRLTRSVPLAKNVGLSGVQIRQAHAVVETHVQEMQNTRDRNFAAEVTNASTHCRCLLLADVEPAVPFIQFPWFKKATIEQLSNGRRPTEDHLYWPQLDSDLSIESFRKPEKFPLVLRSAAQHLAQPESQRRATRPTPQCWCAFIEARASRHTDLAKLSQTLGIVGTDKWIPSPQTQSQISHGP